MKTILLSLCFACLVLTMPMVLNERAEAGESTDKLKPIKTWVGKNLDASKLAAYPAEGFVANKEDWEKLWKAWYPDKALPLVDFSSELILVAKVRGPNRMRVGRLIITDGELSFQPISTKRGGTGFGHLLVKVPRDELKSVNGIAVPAWSVDLADAIDVNMVGKITTGVVAIGSETTGTTMTCGNITWQLLLDESQLKIAKQLGNQKARVTGRLSMRPGTEIAKHWIVKVKTIANAAEEMPANEEMHTEDALNAFVSITTVQSGGIAGSTNSTTVRADGSLSKPVSFGGKKPTNQMPLPALVQLHQLIKDTDWSKVPKQTRNRNAADTFQFDVTIKTRRGSQTFSIDQSSLRSVQPLDRLLNLFR